MELYSIWKRTQSQRSVRAAIHTYKILLATYTQLPPLYTYAHFTYTKMDIYISNTESKNAENQFEKLSQFPMHWKMRLFIIPFAKNSPSFPFSFVSFSFLHFSIQFTMHPTIYFFPLVSVPFISNYTHWYIHLSFTHTQAHSHADQRPLSYVYSLSDMYTRTHRHVRTHTANATIWLFFRVFLWARKRLFHSLKQAKMKLNKIRTFEMKRNWIRQANAST